MKGADAIEIELDSLEFEGLEVAEPEQVRAAFEAELIRLIAERGLPARLTSRAEASFDGAELSQTELGSPERLGQAVARHVYAELGR
jgi:hypothetical protein